MFVWFSDARTFASRSNRLPFLVLGKRVRQNLDGHIPAELRIARAIDLPHAAFADRLDDLVVGQLVTGLHDRTMLRRGKRRA